MEDNEGMDVHGLFYYSKGVILLAAGIRYILCYIEYIHSPVVHDSKERICVWVTKCENVTTKQ